MPAFEDDLRLTREARKRTLEQVQQETRIPVDVLKRFEDGDLAHDATYNEVYLKAFLRSYARAIGVPQGDAVAAYEADRRGAYRGELHPDFDPATAPPPPPPPPPADDASEPPSVSAPPSVTTPNRPAAPSPPTPAASRPEAAPTPVAALASASPVAALRAAPVVGERVSRPVVKGARRSYDKNWASIIGLTVAVVAVLGAVLWFLFRGDDTPDDALVTATGVAAQIDSAGVGAGAASGGPQFQLPITVSVAAAGDGLQSFRVTKDGGDRRPFWINAGASETFTSDSSLTLWGEDPGGSFADATLELQGIRWTPASGQPVVLNRATGQRLLDSLSAARVAPAPTAPAP